MVSQLEPEDKKVREHPPWDLRLQFVDNQRYGASMNAQLTPGC